MPTHIEITPYHDLSFCPVSARAWRRVNGFPVIDRTAPIMPMSAEAARLFAQARRIKGETLRGEVVYCLYQGAVNADDTCLDGYDAFSRANYPDIADFWAMVFRTSAALMATERSISTTARNWLARRGLVG